MIIAEGSRMNFNSSHAAANRPKRIFWLGMHKILVSTELARLRALGYEVFNPPYLSHVFDQSAKIEWDSQQQSTLPRDIIETLSSYNFFYSNIDKEISEILNYYFDAAVVTIVGRWCSELARVFEKPILFRAYGQTDLLSLDFDRLGLAKILSERKNFFFAPHSQETGELEQDWLKKKTTVIPYCLPEDVFLHRNFWTKTEEKSKEILVTAPNIHNPYHGIHYKFLKKYFFKNQYKFIGVQKYKIYDPQIVGTIDRKSIINKFIKASGYLYTYRNQGVCYLPPIEMMAYGGPVLYLSGSLLAVYFNNQGPGECRTIEEAHLKSERLLSGDRTFIAELQAAQGPVLQRYDPDHVWPEFDRKVLAILGDPHQKDSPADAPRPQTPFGAAMAYNHSVILLRSLLGSLSNRANPEEVAVVATSALLDSLAGHATAGAAASKKDGFWSRGSLGAQEAAEAKKAPEAPGQDDPRVRRLRATIDKLRAETTGGNDLVASWFHGPVETTLWGGDDLLHHPASGSQLGRWIVEKASGRIVRLAEIGRAGYVQYGPYLTLAKGRYKVRFELQATSEASQPAGFVDAGFQATVLASAPIPSTPDRARQAITLHFSLAEDAKGMEFRINSNGAAELLVYGLYLYSLDG